MAFGTQPGTASQYYGRLSQLRYWSIITAYGLAAAQGIKLGPNHLRMLTWLREEYELNGNLSILGLCERIDAQFQQQGGCRYFLRLFPSGINSALKIAGLPVIKQKPLNRISGLVH